MKSTRDRTHSAEPQGLPAILFSVGSFVFAIAASAVAEIQVPAQAPLLENAGGAGSVSSSLVRDGRRYWVVDANRYFQVPRTRSKRLLLFSEMPIALKVDSILRMTTLPKILPLPQAFHGEERKWYLGLAVLEEQVVPVVNPASLLKPETLAELQAQAGTTVHLDPAAVLA